MNYNDNVKVVTIDCYTSNDIKPLISIGDVGQFIGYLDGDRKTAIVRFDNGYRLLPVNYLEYA